MHQHIIYHDCIFKKLPIVFFFLQILSVSFLPNIVVDLEDIYAMSEMESKTVYI